MSLRKSVLKKARRIVVKLGTQLLTAPEGDKFNLDVTYIHAIAEQVAALRRRRIEVTLVSSGAIGAGCMELGLSKRPTDVAQLQAIAAAGQPRLMTLFHQAFEKQGIKIAQLLLTRDDFEQRVRFLNIRNSVNHLHKIGCVPIINENDTVSVDELRFGDNDILAALVCNALRADALVILFPLDGLLDAKGQTVDLVTDILAAADAVQETKTTFGTGGMSTKLHAARLVSDAGEPVVIANGRHPDILQRLFDAERIGTVFAPAGRKLDSRQRWIGLTKKPVGTVTIDAGASTALQSRGKSLLASGVVDATGRFEYGEVVLVRDETGREVARGLINYSADELHLIMGRRSDQLEKILGRKAYVEVVHRDNLVLTRT